MEMFKIVLVFPVFDSDSLKQTVVVVDVSLMFKVSRITNVLCP